MLEFQRQHTIDDILDEETQVLMDQLSMQMESSSLGVSR